MDVSPCKGCNKRSEDCHVSCIAYTVWKEETSKIKSALKEELGSRRRSDAFRNYWARQSYSDKRIPIYGRI